MNPVNTQPYSLPSDATWLVTGCSSGIGRAIAELVATKPTQKLIATARKLESLSYLPDKPNVLKLSLDVASSASVDKAFREIEKYLGSQHTLDVLVNNAGYSLAGDAEGATEDQMHQLFETNFFGTVRVTSKALPIMRKEKPRRGGVIFNISSVVGVCTFPGHAFYSSSKFAVNGWTECVAKEMHPSWGINFCLVAPGAVKTNFETTSKIHISPVEAYSGEDMPARKMDAMVNKNRGAGVGVEPSAIAEAIYHVASRNDEIPMHLPLTVIATKMMMLQTEDRLQQFNGLSELSAIDKNVSQWKVEA